MGGGGGGCCPRTTACEKWIKEGVATSKTPKTACKKKDFGHKGGCNPQPPPPPRVSAPELSESVQTLPEFYLSLKYYKYSTTIPFASGLCSQYRLTVAVSEKFCARSKTKGSSHTIGKKKFLGIAGPPLCRGARGSVPPYPPPPPLLPLNGTD